MDKMEFEVKVKGTNDEGQVQVEVGDVRWKKIREDEQIQLEDAHLRGEDFSGQKLEWFSAVGSRFESCRFERMRIKEACFGSGRKQSEYLDCTFDGSRIRFGPAGNARFVRCSFRDTDLRDWMCFEVELVDCVFSGRLRDAWFNGSVPQWSSIDEYNHRNVVGRERNEFRGNDFSQMDLLDVDFRTGVDLSLQRLPTSPEYLYVPNAPAAVEKARQEVAGWTDAERRRRILSFLKSVLDPDVHGDQRQLLFRVDTYFKRDRPDAQVVFDLLKKFA